MLGNKIGLIATMVMGEFDAATKRYTAQVAGMEATTAGAAGRMSKGMSGVGSMFLKALPIIMAVGISFGGLSRYMTGAVSAALDMQRTQGQLNAVLASTGGVAGVTAQAANDLATALSHVTTFDDKTVLSAENLMLTFRGISKDVFPQAIEAALNMSQALGQDTKSSVMQLGKALQDPITGITAMRRVGIQFTDSQEKLIKKLFQTGDVLGAQKEILKEVTAAFGYSARAAGQELPGRLTILQNRLGVIQRALGFALLRPLESVTKYLEERVPKWQKALEDYFDWLENQGKTGKWDVKTGKFIVSEENIPETFQTAINDALKKQGAGAVYIDAKGHLQWDWHEFLVGGLPPDTQRQIENAWQSVSDAVVKSAGAGQMAWDTLVKFIEGKGMGGFGGGGGGGGFGANVNPNLLPMILKRIEKAPQYAAAGIPEFGQQLIASMNIADAFQKYRRGLEPLPRTSLGPLEAEETAAQEFEKQAATLYNQLQQEASDFAIAQGRAEEDFQNKVADIRRDAAEAQLQAEEQYQRDRTGIIEDAAHEQADAERKLGQDISDAKRDAAQAEVAAQVKLGQDLVDARKDAAQAEQDAAAKLALDIQNVMADAASADAAASEKYLEDRADVTKDANRKAADAQRSFQAEIARIDAEHRYNQEDAIRANDAVAYLREERNYSRQREDAARNAAVQRQQNQADEQRRLEDMAEAAKQEAEQRKKDAEQKVKELTLAAEQEALQRKTELQRRLADLQTQYDQERAARAVDLQNRIVEMQVDFQRETAERQRETQRKLEDLAASFEYETKLRQRDLQRKLDEAQRQYNIEAQRRAEDFRNRQNQEIAAFQQRQNVANGYYRAMGDAWVNFLNRLKAGIVDFMASTPRPAGSNIPGMARGGSFVIPMSHGYEQPLTVRVSGGERMTITPAGGASSLMRLDVRVTSDGALSPAMQRQTVRLIDKTFGRALAGGRI